MGTVRMLNLMGKSEMISAVRWRSTCRWRVTCDGRDADRGILGSLFVVKSKRQEGRKMNGLILELL